MATVVVPRIAGAVAYDPTSVGITGGQITGVSGVSYDIAKWEIPVIQVPTGTMANNGVATFGTALPVAYANAYFVVPAGAIATGVPAAEDVYFGQMSSTTVVTLFNNTLSANLNSVGAPLIPASPTAFVTTGPGAFTGVTTGRTLVTITVPAGAMGASGELDIWADHSCVSAATNKIVTCIFGGTNLVSVTQQSVSAISYACRVKNRSATAQTETHTFSTTSATTIQPATYPAINTGNAVAVSLQLQKATATEYSILEGGRVSVIPT